MIPRSVNYQHLLWIVVYGLLVTTLLFIYTPDVSWTVHEKADTSHQTPRARPAQRSQSSLPQRRPVTASLESKRVLITGAAGFIGFHLALALNSVVDVDVSSGTRRRNFVTGLDNFNSYYDVRLKYARSELLLRHGVVVHHADVCNETFLMETLSKYKLTHVVHLAAQAGVRYSLKEPLAYVTSNVECVVKLLRVLDRYPSVKLVYSSSSSVYGVDADVPFQTSWPPPGSASITESGNAHSVKNRPRSRPGNMYAATKLAGEALVNVHCQRQLRSRPTEGEVDSGKAYHVDSNTRRPLPIGLRLFTVYGPWGRPDMAIYQFAAAIDAGRVLSLYTTRDNKPMSRDFTYIDDVISGIVAAMDYEPVVCGEIFNIGRGSPVSVQNMIALLETEMNKTAKIELLPLPPTELIQTFADVCDAETYLNFHPKTDLAQGLHHFVSWYRSYSRNVSADGRLKRR